VAGWSSGHRHIGPDLYVPYLTRSARGSAAIETLSFIPETGTSAANVIVAVGKYNTIGFSPFALTGEGQFLRTLASTYQMLEQLSPVILPHQGTDSITGVRMVQGDPPNRSGRRLHAHLYL